MYKVSFLLFSFLSQNVTVKSVLSLDFTCSGKSESFFRTGVSLDLWSLVLILNHFYSNKVVTNYSGALRTLFILVFLPLSLEHQLF